MFPDRVRHVQMCERQRLTSCWKCRIIIRCWWRGKRSRQAHYIYYIVYNEVVASLLMIFNVFCKMVLLSLCWSLSSSRLPSFAQLKVEVNVHASEMNVGVTWFSPRGLSYTLKSICKTGMGTVWSGGFDWGGFCPTFVEYLECALKHVAYTLCTIDMPEASRPRYEANI